MKNSLYPFATGIAIAGAGVALAFTPGTAQAAPMPALPLSPAASPMCLLSSECSPSGLIGSNILALSPNTPTPNALAAALIGPAANAPLYDLIGIAGLVPIVNIFVDNGTNGAPGTG